MSVLENFARHAPVVTTGAPTVLVSSGARDLLTTLTELHGALVVHHAGGACAGSDPMCHAVGTLHAGSREVAVGEIVLPDPLPPVTVLVADEFADGWESGEVVLDVARGRGSGFSLEAPEGVRFVARSYG
ncbi:DUF779 domain-containing protein [Williamsia sp. CHRR-6]|uniref:DUF779 domain-containing protein n=1 Tax=Williamsia sp. CHRR-6 TaxID=2835871 RepID=UPI001BDB1D2E|nr:DUF779 domain-containing protein [Williamsia sp. CHRR-6]MBT0567694.1 DUF779 domain-containing protein [Williamsia sp. CHRR-6]